MSEELTLTIKGFTDEDQVRAFCGWYSGSLDMNKFYYQITQGSETVCKWDRFNKVKRVGQ